MRKTFITIVGSIYIFLMFFPLLVILFFCDFFIDVIRVNIFRKKLLKPIDLMTHFTEIFYMIPMKWIHNMRNGRKPNEETDRYRR